MTASERSAARLRRGREREEEDTARLSAETGGGGQVGGAGGDELQQRAFGRPAVGDLLGAARERVRMVGTDGGGRAGTTTATTTRHSSSFAWSAAGEPSRAR